MWILSSTQKDAVAHDLHLIGGGTYLIGRRGCDILLSQDKSISRKHAQLVVGLIPPDHISDFSFRPQISLRDTSKYGSFIVTGPNEQKLVTNEEMELVHDSTIRFGLLSTTMKVRYIPYVLCPSLISNRKTLGALAENASVIGAHVHYGSNWVAECTHLVMESVEITPKLIVALLSGCPVVKPSWVEAVRLLERPDVVMPDPAMFIPEWGDAARAFLEPYASSVSLLPNPMRSSLFRQKRFVFLNPKQAEKYRDFISRADGTAHDASERLIDKKFIGDFGTAFVIDPLEKDLEDSETDPSRSVYEAKRSQLLRAQFQLFDGTVILKAILMSSLSPCLLLSSKPDASLLEPHLPGAKASSSKPAPAEQSQRRMQLPPQQPIPPSPKHAGVSLPAQSAVSLPADTPAVVLQVYQNLLRPSVSSNGATRSLESPLISGKRFRKQFVHSSNDGSQIVLSNTESGMQDVQSMQDEGQGSAEGSALFPGSSAFSSAASVHSAPLPSSAVATPMDIDEQQQTSEQRVSDPKRARRSFRSG
eukprot:ANDGO_06310.mRNA.1 Nijmegen breakage syndrome 1 protein